MCTKHYSAQLTAAKSAILNVFDSLFLIYFQFNCRFVVIPSYCFPKTVCLILEGFSRTVLSLVYNDSAWIYI